MSEPVSLVPCRLDESERVLCQGWGCSEPATWKLWASRYCYEHMIGTGFLCGPRRRVWDQFGLPGVN